MNGTATERNRYQETERTLEVTGRLWSGPICEHVYKLKLEQKPASLHEAQRIAGDFCYLSGALVVTTVRDIEEVITTEDLH
jgi:hypothetical protein